MHDARVNCGAFLLRFSNASAAKPATAAQTLGAALALELAGVGQSTITKNLFSITTLMLRSQEASMLEKNIGEPCPTCETPLQRRRSTFRTIVGDVAFCARCCSSFEIASEKQESVAALLATPVLSPV